MEAALHSVLGDGHGCRLCFQTHVLKPKWMWTSLPVDAISQRWYLLTEYFPNVTVQKLAFGFPLGGWLLGARESKRQLNHLVNPFPSLSAHFGENRTPKGYNLTLLEKLCPSWKAVKYIGGVLSLPFPDSYIIRCFLYKLVWWSWAGWPVLVWRRQPELVPCSGRLLEDTELVRWLWLCASKKGLARVGARSRSRMLVRVMGC